MSLDPAKFQAVHYGNVVSRFTGEMVEGMSYDECWPYDVTGLGVGDWPQTVAYWTMPARATIPAGVYQLKTKVKTSGSLAGSYATAYITASGGSGSSAPSAQLTADYVEYTFDITVSSDISTTDGVWKVAVTVMASGVDKHGYCLMNYDGMYFGVKSGESGLARSTFSLNTNYYPAQGTHANPTLMGSSLPEFSAKFENVYPNDAVTLVKYEDTLASEAHSATNPTTQTIGTAEASSTYVSPTWGLRTITCQADATRKMDATNNTYYVLTVKDADGGAVGTVAYELLLDASAPQLVTLNGNSSTSYVTLSHFTPIVQWTDPNADTTHWRVKVYETDGSEVWDSTETLASTNYVQIPSTAGLDPLTVYYVIVTLMCGSGGSTWQIDSRPGYFYVDNTETTVKITSHAGTAGAAGTITTLTPTIEWSFGRTQSAYNVSVVDESDGSTAYASGWTASSTKSHEVASGLSYGETYSVQVQVRDTLEDHNYTSDERAYIHTNEATVPAPTLDAEADTDHLTDVTLEWTAPSITDGDALTYEIELIGSISSGSSRTAKIAAFRGWIASSTAKWRAYAWGDDTSTTAITTTYNSGSATSLILGCLPIASYTWRVRATDEHGVVGSWSDTDTFTVSDGGVVPVCHLVPAATQVAPLVTSWYYTDQDGDVQSKYQVQLASDAGFTSIVEDSGEVASTNLHYEHSTTSAGAYYRRARVYTGAWSAWDDDEVTIVGPTVQSDELALYLDAEGTPAALDQSTYPISGMTVSYRANAPAEAVWTINNFDGTEAGIDDDEEVLIYLKDSAGNRVTFRGGITQKDVGDMVTFTAKDISRLFDYWRVTKNLSMMTLGQVIESIVEDPTGNCSTGITAHCDEINTTSGVVSLSTFDGQGKTLAAWLSEFGAATGYFWRIEWLNGAYHFYWYDPSAQPTYSVTLQDSVLDRADNDATHWRISDNIRVVKDRSQYANRIVFAAIPDPPVPPGGVTDFDTLLTESTTGWYRFEDTYTDAPAVSSTYKYRGSYSVNFEWEMSGAGVYPRFIPLGYRRLPAVLQDMRSNPSFGYLRVRARLTLGGHTPYDSSFAGGFEDSLTSSNFGYLRPHIRPVMYLLTSETAISEYASMEFKTIYSDNGSLMVDCIPNANWAGSYNAASYYAPGCWCDWRFNLPSTVGYNAGTVDPSQWSHVLAIGFGFNVDAYCPPQAIGGTLYQGASSDDSIYTPTRKAAMQIDDMRIDSVPVSEAPLEMYVESAAVTAGSEAPIEASLGVTGLNTSSARKLANLKLTDLNRTRQSVSAVEIDGIRNIPLRSQLTLNLDSRGIASTTLALHDLKFYPYDSGDKTEVSVGDPKMDDKRVLARLRQKLDGIVTT